MNSLKRTIGTALVIAATCLVGCGSYSTPGGPANFRALNITPEQLEAQTDVGIAERMNRQPLASFPTSIAVARVQDRGYKSHTARGVGDGRFTVVTARDVETEEHFQKLAQLPMVRGIAPMNRLVLPRQLNSDFDLRQAAAQLQADMLLIYTFDTVFTTESKAAPLAVVTLGLFPERQARVSSTASAALMDTRNGYIYGLAEATAHTTQLANAWTNKAAVDASRRRVEQQAFDDLVGELSTMWMRVAQTYGPEGEAVVGVTE